MHPRPQGIVGRDDELRWLGRAIEAGGAFAVVGEAGIGKTSLIRAATAAANVRIHEGGGFATLRHTPLLALQRAIGQPLTGDLTDVAATVERVVGPDLLFIDDLQWVDARSHAVLDLLVGRIAVATTIRADDDGASSAIALIERHGFARLTLGGVDAAAAEAIVRERAPRLAPNIIDSVVARAGGNPLVLAESAAFGGPSPSVRRAIAAGLDRLTSAARDQVELLATLDRPIEARRLGSAAHDLVASGMLVETDGVVVVRHALIREAILADLEPARRAELHARAAALAVGPIEAARHLVAAGDPDRAVALAEQALGRTQDRTEQAALLLVLATAPAATPAIRLEAGRALSDVSDWESAIRVLATEEDWPTAERSERAALLAHAAFATGDHERARIHVEAARDTRPAPGSAEHARVAIEVAAYMVNVDGRLAEALAYLDDQLAGCPPGLPTTVMIAAVRESIAMLASLNVDLAVVRRAFDVAVATQAYATAADMGRVIVYSTLIWHGAEPALAYIDATAPALTAVGASTAAIEVATERVQASLLAGRPEAAMLDADRLLERPMPPRARQAAMIFSARALGVMGYLDDAEARLDSIEPDLTDDYLGRGEWLHVRAELALSGGRPARAATLIEEARRIPGPIRGAHAMPELTLAWARWSAGHAPEPAGSAVSTPIQAGIVPEIDGLTRLAAGDPIDAADRFKAAARAWSGYDAEHVLRCEWAHGEALRLAGERDLAIATLGTALDRAVADGFAIEAARIRRSMRQAGIRVGVATGRARTSARLTPRERELVELVARGQSNIEAARRMGLGRPTVARMLSNAMTRLGAQNRAQLVAMVEDLDD